MSNAPAGWYADPNDPNHMRYWDGQTWSTHTTPRSSAQVDLGAASGSGIERQGQSDSSERSNWAFGLPKLWAFFTNLSQLVQGIIALAVAFSFLGTLLTGIWIFFLRDSPLPEGEVQCRIDLRGGVHVPDSIPCKDSTNVLVGQWRCEGDLDHGDGMGWHGDVTYVTTTGPVRGSLWWALDSYWGNEGNAIEGVDNGFVALDTMVDLLAATNDKGESIDNRVNEILLTDPLPETTIRVSNAGPEFLRATPGAVERTFTCYFD